MSVAPPTPTATRPAWAQTVVLVGLAVLLTVSMIACMGLGAVRIDAGEIVRILASTGRPDAAIPPDLLGPRQIVLSLRAPRIFLGAVVGAGLALVGAVLQAVTRNPLADPYLFGVSSGASAGAVLVILVLASGFGPFTTPVFAFAGALLAMAIVFALGRDAGGARDRLVLTGVAVHFVFMAITDAMILSSPVNGADSALFWMLGGFGAARWELVLPALAALVAVGALILHRARQLDALSLGDEGAHTLGVPVRRLRLEMFLGSAVLTGVLVAVSGAVGFIGLVIPHCARWTVGPRLRASATVGALMGAIFAVWMDAAARTLFAPKELPLGVMTAAVGGVFFLLVLRQRRSSLSL